MVNDNQKVEIPHVWTKEQFPTWAKWLIGISVPIIMIITIIGSGIYHQGTTTEHIHGIDNRLISLELGQHEILTEIHTLDKEVTINGFRIGELENDVNKLASEVEQLKNSYQNGINNE